MIADTTFLSDYLKEQRNGFKGPAHDFMAANRAEVVRVSIISAGEVAILFKRISDAWAWLDRWTIYRLHPDIVNEAVAVDRELIASGERLGENDNWIAGFARYYRQPIISRDAAFDRVKNLRRVEY